MREAVFGSKNDKNILKLKFGIAIISLLCMVTGSKLLFGSWSSIHLSFWILIGIFVYAIVHQLHKISSGRNSFKIFYYFDLAGTITYLLITALATIMVLIIYPVTALSLFGMFFVTLAIHGGLRFIFFDFTRNRVDGLSRDGYLSLTKLTFYIHPDNSQVEIKVPGMDNILILRKDRYCNQTWIRIINNFKGLEMHFSSDK